MKTYLYRDKQNKKISSKNQSVLTYQFQNKKNQNLPQQWVDQQTIGKKFSKESISNEFTNQKDKKKSSVEEVSLNDRAKYDKTRFNHQNLSAFSKLQPFQSCETHIYLELKTLLVAKKELQNVSLGVENIVGSKKKNYRK